MTIAEIREHLAGPGIDDCEVVFFDRARKLFIPILSVEVFQKPSPKWHTSPIRFVLTDSTKGMEQ